MESRAQGIRLRQHLSQTFPRMGAGGCLLPTMEKLLTRYDDLKGIDWEWQVVDTATVAAPLGEITGPSPVDRLPSSAQSASIICDGHGILLGLILAAANENDNALAEDTLDSLLADRPEPTADKPQNFCADKGYDDNDVRQAGEDRHVYRAHLASWSNGRTQAW